MLSPSDSSTNRMARLVMRTHAVPMPVHNASGPWPVPPSTNGNAASAMAMSTMPIHAPRGCFFGSSRACMTVLCAVADALAQQSGRPEDEHRDQHEKREHVLI